MLLKGKEIKKIKTRETLPAAASSPAEHLPPLALETQSHYLTESDQDFSVGKDPSVQTSLEHSFIYFFTLLEGKLAKITGSAPVLPCIWSFPLL